MCVVGIEECSGLVCVPVEVKGQPCGMDSLFPPLLGFQGLNLPGLLSRCLYPQSHFLVPKRNSLQSNYRSINDEMFAV